MSSTVWAPSEDGLDKVTRKDRQQEALNLYVQPETSPGLEERLLRDSLSLQHNGHATERNGDASPQHFTSAGYQNKYAQDGLSCISFGGGQAAHGDVGPAFKASSPSKALSEVSCVLRHDDHCPPGAGVPLLEPQPTWPVDQPTTMHTAEGCQPMPEDQPHAQQAVGVEAMQMEYGAHQAPASSQPGEATGGGDLLSVQSLNLSGPDGDLLDQLLGPEAGGGSPPIVTPSSFQGAGPFGDASLQPALSDHSRHPTPAQLADLWYAEAESGGNKDEVLQGQQPLPNAYSEPLPFSAATPHHLAMHPACPMGAHRVAFAGRNGSRLSNSGVQAESGAAAASGGTVGQGLSAHNGVPAVGHANPSHSQARASTDVQGQQAQAPLPQSQHLQQQTQPPRVQSQPCHGAQAATPHRLSRSLDEHDIRGAYSAPAPVLLGQQGPAGAPLSAGVASSPMHVDEQARSLSHESLTGEGAAAISTGSALGTSHCAKGVATTAGEDGPAATTAQQSPVDSRGKQPRPPQQEPPLTTARPAAPAPQNQYPPPSGYHPSGSGGVAGTGARPNSPAGRSQSAGDPMSVSCLDGGVMYGHGPPYSYPYGMQPSYAMPYGMPYGDPYYHPGYGYNHLMDGPPAPGVPGPAVPDYCDPLAMQPGGTSVDPVAHRAMHYPGYMAPRHRLYRRFITGVHGRREVAGQPVDALPGEAAAAAQEGSLVSMASAPPGSINASMARCAPAIARGPPAPSATASTAPVVYAKGPTGGTSSSNGAVGRAKGTAAATATAPPCGAVEPRSASGLQADMDAVMEGFQAARECHAQFSADDMPLPLPRSAVDGIRQELRVVTQELLQRRMEEARTHRRLAPGSEGLHSRLQPSNSWAPGDAYASARQQSKQQSACAQGSHLDTASGSLSAPSAAAATRPNPTHGGATTTTLPHKRTAPSGPTAGAGLSPARPRPAPSAPTSRVSQALGPMQPAGHRSDGCTSIPMADPAVAPIPAGVPAPAGSAPVWLNQPGAGVPAHACGPAAMRQLFPPPGPGSLPAGPTGCGPGPVSQQAPAAGGKPQLVAATTASAPPGPRPALSGKSAASATQSASVAQAPGPAAGAAQQQLQQKAAGPVPIGSYRVGQQGSMAADAEDDGEEVHGPPHCSSKSAGPPVGVASGAATAAVSAGQPPLAPGYYGAAMGPPPYEYPAGYYYPPAMSAYGMRMYSMPPHVMPSAPPGYRGAPPSVGVPMYGMPPPNMQYGMGGAVWGEYGMNPASQTGIGMTSGPEGVVPASHARGSIAGA